MRTIKVKACTSKTEIKKHKQLAWKLAEIASDNSKLSSDSVEMAINRIIDNASVAIAAINRKAVITARQMALPHKKKQGSSIFGISISYFPQPVTEVISSGLYWTLFLAGTSLIISFVLGSLIGVYLAWYRDQKLDSILLPSLSFLGAFPYFFIAMLFLYYFGFILGWFPLRHAFGESVTAGFNLEFIFSVITHSILPAFTLIFVTLGGWVLSMRNNMIATLGSEYINYAKAVGYNRKILMFKFAARNALLPSVTSFGMALGFILSGALLTEIIFSYPGQGYLLLQAVRSQDFPLLQGIFLTITFSVLLSNWIVDIVLMLLDPRVRR